MIGLKGVFSFQGGLAKDCEPAKKIPTSYYEEVKFRLGVAC
jgi:hypothetical protein